MIASISFGKMARQLLIGLAIIGVFATALGSFQQASSLAGVQQEVKGAVVGVVSQAIDEDQASAAACQIGRDLHYGYRVCAELTGVYLGNRIWRSWVYVYGVGWRYLTYYDYLNSPNIYIR